MIYQLPNGKVIHLSVEQFLDMSDADIDRMVKSDTGDYVTSPFHGSAIREKKVKKEEDNSIDFEPDLEEKDHHGNGGSETAEEEDFPDLPDNLINE